MFCSFLIMIILLELECCSQMPLLFVRLEK